MKREIELVRDILFSIEKTDDIKSINTYPLDIVNKHVDLLIEGGFVIKNNYGFDSVFLIDYRLTWNGHEFLDAIRQNEVWSTIKTEFKDASISTIFKVGKELVEGITKKKLEKYIGFES
ncbi:DUF2513 domain-containing protein [Aliivibrio fischeri]|uniref:DUF2513 domain-containing protein n=1 Tax=Aliivibrio fischeri TaxID=668 RepID=UPI0012D8BB29